MKQDDVQKMSEFGAPRLCICYFSARHVVAVDILIHGIVVQLHRRSSATNAQQRGENLGIEDGTQRATRLGGKDEEYIIMYDRGNGND